MDVLTEVDDAMGTVPGSLAHSLATNTVGKLSGLLLFALGALQDLLVD